MRISDPWAWSVPVGALILLTIIYTGDANLLLFLDINQALRDVPDPIWRHITVLGDTLVMLCFLLPFIGKKPQIVWSCVLAGIITGVVVQSLKFVFAVPRPSAILDHDIFNLVGPTLASVYAFPSGHTATIFVLTVIISLFFRKLSLAIPLLAIATIIGVSRIAVGVHWPLDVLGGIFFAWIGSVFGLMLSVRWRWGMRLQGQRVLAIILVLNAIYTAFLHNTHYDTQQFQLFIVVLLLALSANGLKSLWKS